MNKTLELITRGNPIAASETSVCILKSPFPYFGGKRKIAHVVWQAFGAVRNYVEPFFGSGAVLLMRPDEPGTETVNDLDGFVSNFWRALQADPERVASYADWPVNENDLHARHAWLVGQKDAMQARLEGDPEWFDARIAGWWVWGTACWIGSGFCSGNGPWRVQEVDGVRQLVRAGNNGKGINRTLVHVGNNGQGINRTLVHVGDNGRGVNRKRECLGKEDLLGYFNELSVRLRKVRVCCGDWTRVCGPAVTFGHGVTGVFLDPPYADTAVRTPELYRMDSEKVAHDVREWAVKEGVNPLMRIALCGYAGEHEMPNDWRCVQWNAGAGYGGQSASEGVKGNGKKERVWFSPYCIEPEQQMLPLAALNNSREETMDIEEQEAAI